MTISAKTLRKQMEHIKPFLNNCSLATIRKGQNLLGELMSNKYRKQVILKQHHFEQFDSAWILPQDERREGVILYLHGGGLEAY